MTARAPRAATPAVRYRVEPADLHAHLYSVRLELAAPAALQRVSLPVWIPGSYLIREFSRHLQGLQARQPRGKATITQVDKCTWDIHCDPAQPLELRWQVYALDNSVRAAWLDAQRAFFNGTSLLLRAHGQEAAPHSLEITAPRDAPQWQAATGLTPVKLNRRGFGTYQAANYDELVDCPVEMGAFWSGSFEACGVEHRFVVAGAADSFDGERLLADARLICETQIRFWHGRKRPPMQSYVFMLNCVDDGYGGLEHRNSTALIACRKDLPRAGDAKRSEGYITLLGLISHEYFHTWNVKRLRPAAFERYDYANENYTDLLWFFEGFTSYYDDLLLRRCGLIDDATYVRLLGKTLNQVLQAPGRLVQSVAQASHDAWVKFYRQDENTPNATVSYYTKGALLALCFDLTLRSTGQATLDDLMRGLWQRCKAGPMHEADFIAVLEALGGRSFAPEMRQWVHGTRDLPVRELLAACGIATVDEPAQLAQRLGLRVSESDGVRIKMVLRGGAGERAGLAPNDELLGITVAGKTWRILKLDELSAYVGAQRRVQLLVSRDRQVLNLTLEWPRDITTCRLVLRDASKAQSWLGLAR